MKVPSFSFFPKLSHEWAFVIFYITLKESNNVIMSIDVEKSVEEIH